jgi:hypothetical protein
MADVAVLINQGNDSKVEIHYYRKLFDIFPKFQHPQALHFSLDLERRQLLLFKDSCNIFSSQNS